MSDPRLSMTAEVDDDLPRTLRKHRDDKLREAREMEARELEGRGMAGHAESLSPSDPGPPGYSPQPYAADLPHVVVKRLQIPFLHLVGFFLKATLAAIPAMVLMGALIWGGLHLLKTNFPQLIETRILIDFPDTTGKKR